MITYFGFIKKIALLAFLLFINLIIYGQDTMVVQTFTWDSLGRTGYFDFPNDERSFEKIQMIYNMRCFDAAVGNGNVGCKEWDYSCNTFVHVPEMQDSTVAFKYDYEVSQITDDYFAFSPEPHYTWYVFDKIHTNYKNTYSEKSYTITGGNAPDLLVNPEVPYRMQFIYSAEELLGAGFSAGPINGIGFEFVSEQNNLENCEIKLGNWDSGTNGLNEPVFEDLQQVFYRDVTFPAAGLNRFNFHTPFIWDGISSLLVDFSCITTKANHQVEIKAHPANNNSIATGLDHHQNSSLEFGGSWGIELDPSIFESVNDQLTVSFWSFGRPQDMPSRNSTILEGVDENNNRTINIHLPWGNSGIYWDCGNTGSSYDRINKTAEKEEFSTRWNHWAFTKNASTGSMKIYLNGKLWQSGESKTRPVNIKKFRIGSSVSHSLGYYGLIDEFSFWNYELDETTIQQIMTHRIDGQHPQYEHLLAYYDFETGSGNTIYDQSPFHHDAHFKGGPIWRENNKGRNLHQNFYPLNSRPGLYFYRGTYQIDEEVFQTTEELISPQYSVLQYAVENNQLIQLDTFFMWESRDINVYNELGEIVESYFFEPIDFLLFEELEYYTFNGAKLELLSLVTPYGNGLDLGQEGKTFTFDVTDFSPVLKGKRKLTVEFGANQEELDIKFLFIEGTPSRNVLGIQNIWPFARGYYRSIQENRIFEPRNVSIPPGTSQAKIRASVTGHGQNGEFQLRNHRININTNEKAFDFTVWKECAFNPIYPQGGTWIYDRAGWCPGMATDLHEFEISSYIEPGNKIKVDYNVMGAHMDEANYLVSNQLVLYGPPNFTLDASIEHIVRPNKTAVEFSRFNPMCSDPSVIIKNNGIQTLTSLQITYGIPGVSEKEFIWQGSLNYLEMEEVTLPVNSLGFWGEAKTNEFRVKISQPNGGSDQYSPNNTAKSIYEMPDVYEGTERWLLRVKTNNHAFENSYTLVDQAGNIILERKNLENNTTYDDEITLPPGCYSFEIIDAGNDGLSFWNNPAAGSGYVSIRRIENETVSFQKIKFEEDFGGAFNYDFIIDDATNTGNPEHFVRVGLYPNPANEWVKLDAEGLEGGNVFYSIMTMDGRKLQQGEYQVEKGSVNQRISTEGLPDGLYVLKLSDGTSNWFRTFVKM